jgi:hypothetical protein
MLSDEQNLADLDQAETSIEKRNSGRTGPTSTEGQAISARNATRHGMCATTLIMENEVEADWLDLLRTWLDGYQNPAEFTLLYTFVLKTAQAEWRRLRVQSEYDFHMFGHGSPPIGAWQPHEIKNHDLILRYLRRRKPLQPAGTETMRRKPLQPAGTETTAAERRFQGEYRMLEHHFKTHPAAQAASTGRNGNHKPVPEPKKATKQPEPEPQKPRPKILYVNNDTGESVDAQGNYYPPPPDYKPEPIIPGVYPPDHPAYERPNKVGRGASS